MIGQQFDNYYIEKQLDQGGMADIFLARDLALQRLVALKVLKPELAQDAEFVARFHREIRATAQINHPNMVHVYGTGSTPEGRPYLAMQYVRGGSLHDQLKQLKIQNKSLTAPAALRLVRQIADALGAAHAAGIIHRDIKPTNILIHENGMPLLSDLGIASVKNVATQLTRTGTVLGTPHYMSPEQSQNHDVDGRSDIYSLGVILYELLAQKRPFEADSPLVVLHQQIYEQPEPLDKINPNLATATYIVADACLQKAPDNRYQNADELAAALDRAIQAEESGEPVPGLRPLNALPGSAAPLTRQTVRRFPRWPLTAIAVIILVVAGGIFGLRTRPKKLTGVAATPAVVSTTTARPILVVVASPTLAPTATDTSAATAVPANTPTLTTTTTIAPTYTPLVIPSATPLPLPTPALTAPYGRIVFTCYMDEVDDICAINVDGRFETRLTNNPTTDFYASWSPDGREVAFSSRRDGSFLAYRMNADGGDLRQLGPANIGAVYAPAISPDGQRVALAVDESGQQSVWVSNLDGSNPVKLSTAGASLDPVWSPDGRQLAFASNLEGAMAHFIINADGTGLRKLETDVADISGRCDWSPDGRWLAFYAGPRNDRDIYLAAIDGTAVYQLTDGGGNLAPSFSPDGHWITFTSYRDGDAEIFIMRIDGSGVTQLTFNGRPDWQPNWGP